MADGSILGQKAITVSSDTTGNRPGALTGATSFGTISGTSISGAATYTGVAVKSTTGVGSGATFTVVKTGSGTSYNGAVTISYVAAGTGYLVGDTIVIAGNSLGGVNSTNDLTFKIATATSATAGMMRFNTTTSYMEYFDGTQWNAITAPPIVTTVSPTTYSGDAGTTITVNGSLFSSGSVVAFSTQGAPATYINAASTTFVSSSQLTCTTPQDFLVTDGPLNIRVTNTSGLTATATGALSTGSAPAWSTSAGSLATIYDNARAAYGNITVTATDSETGGAIAGYSIVSGAVPTGMSFNTSTGVISGTASSVGSDTTSSFTIRATDNAGNTTDRAFSITIKAPTYTSYTSGSGTWTAPTGVSSVWVMVQAGGGGGGGSGVNGGGGGGAGGMVEHTSYPVSPGTGYSYSVGGAGGAGGTGSTGSNSTFASITANGGGGGGPPGGPGLTGGCGGGRGRDGSNQYGPSNQSPSAGGTGYGNRGGGGPAGGCNSGGGGGGTGAVGYDGGPDCGAAHPGTMGAGGDGRSTSVSGSSVAYGGGGGGGFEGPQPRLAGGAGGGGGGGGNVIGPAQNGTDNRGGGGGGGQGSQSGGAGGVGIVILKY
jgi:hypothetical protein